MCSILVMAMPMSALASDEKTEMSETGVCFVINADKDLDFSKDDRIKVTVMNNSIQKEEVVEFSAKEALDYAPVDLPEGHYSVRGVEYLGDNATLQNEEIAITSNFAADIDYDLVYMAVGDVSRESLIQEYYDVFLVESDGKMKIAGKENSEEYLNEAQRRIQADLEDGINPKKDYRNQDVTGTKDVEERSEEKTEEQTSKKSSRLWGLLPITIVGVIGGVILYVLRKKKIL